MNPIMLEYLALRTPPPAASAVLQHDNSKLLSGRLINSAKKSRDPRKEIAAEVKD